MHHMVGGDVRAFGYLWARFSNQNQFTLNRCLGYTSSLTCCLNTYTYLDYIPFKEPLYCLPFLPFLPFLLSMMGPKKKVMKVSTKTMTQSRGLKTRSAKKAVREPSPSPPSPASSMALDEELAQASQRGPTPPSEPVQEPVQEPDLQADIPDLRQGE